MDSADAFQFLWAIEDVIYSGFREKVQIYSPAFTVNKIDKSQFRLFLYLGKDYIGFYIRREGEPASILLNFELSILTTDGSFKRVHTLTNCNCSKDTCYGRAKFLTRSELRDTLTTKFEGNCTLLFRSLIWKNPAQFSITGQCYARTRFGFEKVTAVGVIENFSSLKIGEIANIRLISASNPKFSTPIYIYVSSGTPNEQKVVIEIIPGYEPDVKFTFYGIHLLDDEGNTLECKTYDTSLNRFEKETPKSSSWFFPLAYLKTNNGRFLSNDVLKIRFESIKCYGVIFEEMRKIIPEVFDNEICMKMSASQPTSFPFQNQATSVAVHRVQDNENQIPNSLTNDLLALYHNRIDTDLELRAETETFLVHRSILMARSPVFRDRLLDDTNTKIIEIKDIDIDTLKRLIFFMYTDKVEEITWGDATKLHVAANVFGIELLKQKCFTIVEKILCSSNVCGILDFADKHQDENIKAAAQQFVLANSWEVFETEEWKYFMLSNARVAGEIMYLKLKQDRAGNVNQLH
ncbi:TD and POZ domain-containing protein 1 [Trichonephila inaurata madagascariensis]|uniref:TD and POZ domain-containing protein 1 n=1 Tax=Trichonephila inaurata madagascariensis TaxID=2747483 RepID=A0A8X6WSX4_9ARAC|nr:TD and POZ domain-containing protein 1 [Trichonephila inaurata madagascariensis]